MYVSIIFPKNLNFSIISILYNWLWMPMSSSWHVIRNDIFSVQNNDKRAQAVSWHENKDCRTFLSLCTLETILTVFLSIIALFSTVLCPLCILVLYFFFFLYFITYFYICLPYIVICLTVKTLQSKAGFLMCHQPKNLYIEYSFMKNTIQKHSTVCLQYISIRFLSLSSIGPIDFLV